MRDNIRRLLAPPVFAGDEEKTRLAALLNTVLWTLLTIGALSCLSFLFVPGAAVGLLLVGVIMLGHVASMWLLRRGLLSAASQVFLISLWISMTAVCVFVGGTESSAYFGFMIIVVAAGLLLGGRGAAVFAGLSAVAGLGIVWAESANVLPAPLAANQPITDWIAMIFFVAITAGLISLAASGLSNALLRAHGYAAELEEQRAGLEATVQERTRDLTRRTRYLEVTATIAREATSELELEGLISSVVSSISRQFGFYHAGIFLLDSAGEWAELKAASSEGGQKMLARGHRLRVGQEGMVGYVSRHGESRIALDTGADAVFFDNPDLPQTRSEATLPLRVRGQVIGVLDVQSIEPEAFTQEDITVLQTLADQIATAINNAGLFQQVEESIEAERRAYGDLAGQAWAGLLRTQTDLGFMSDRQTIAPAGDVWTPHMRTALENGQIVSDQDATAVAIPIKVRGHVIGVIDGRKRDGGGGWTEEEVDLMQTFAEQAAVALESARLYQDTQRRAAREQAIRQVTERMRRAVDVEAILQDTVTELAKALGVPRAYVRLGTGAEFAPASGPMRHTSSPTQISRNDDGGQNDA